MLFNLSQYRGVSNIQKLLKNFDNSFVLFFFRMTLIEIVTFKCILSLRALDIVNINLTDAHAVSLRISPWCFIKNFAFFLFLIMYIYHVWIYSLLNNRSGDIEQNPQSKPNSCKTFSNRQWILNNPNAHTYMKIFPLRVYISLNSFDVLCLSENFFDSSTLSANRNLEIL